MLTMKWRTGHDGRLFATWAQSDEPGATGGREETIMLTMKWTINHEGRLVPTPAQSGEPQSSNDNLDSKVPRLVGLCLLTIMRTTVHREVAAGSGIRGSRSDTLHKESSTTRGLKWRFQNEYEIRSE